MYYFTPNEWLFKYFKSDSKNMSFLTEDKDIDLNYSEIWNKNKKLLGEKFSTHPICNEKYIAPKVKVFNGVNKTTFTNDEIPKKIIMSALLQ